MEEYKLTVGLEIHAELKTKTKMFCNSANDPDEVKPNVNICPICLAHPGTLPTINKEAVRQVLRVGNAIGGTISDFTEFDRKNYFYPDIPKGYQISQYEHPLVTGGSLNDVTITRVHLEEDTASSIHFEHRKSTPDKSTEWILENITPDESSSLVDFNRAGVPLMELVTEPVITSAKQAGDFARELQLLLRYLGASEANMEKGEMRVEANISVSKTGERGTKVEVKNLNSFRAAERAIEYEFERQVALLEGGEKVTQETRGWNEAKGETFSQRKKETSQDYRYFPEPDLPKLWISQIPEFQNLKETLPELPWVKRERYARDFGVKAEDVEAYLTDLKLGEFFESVTRELGGDKELIKLASNYISNDLVKVLADLEVGLPIGSPTSKSFAELIKMAGAGEVSSRGAKDILIMMISDERSPKVIAEEKGLIQKSDEGHLQEIVAKIIAENAKSVEDFKAGKAAALQFLIGQGMKVSKGSANPKVLEALFKKALG